MSQRKALAFVLVALLTACASGGGGPRDRTPRNDASGPKTANQLASETQVKLGRGYMDQGQFETAFQKLEKALKLDPNSVDGNTMMAVLYERIDRAKLSEKHYRRAVELDPDDGSTNNNLGAYLCRLGRYDEADAHFRKALDDPFYSTPAAAAANGGVCASRAGNYPAAEAYFRRSLELKPNEAATLYEMSLLNFRKQDFMRARAFMQRFESAGTPDASALDLAAQIEERLGDAAAAAKYRERLKTEFPDYEPGTVSRGSNSP
jgi:type IV pilus assembly protein PilF